MKTYHILNGDSLKDQFPEDQIPGELIVARECLIDGDVFGDSLTDFIATRNRSIHEMYGGEPNSYLKKTEPEIKKMVQLSEGSVNLWFEDDLFCQVNFWFVCSILNRNITVNLIRPADSLQYGFAGLSQKELIEAYQDKYPLSTSHLDTFSKLWKAYQIGNSDKILQEFQAIKMDFPFIEPAVQAQKDRGTPTVPGRPEQTLQSLIDELWSDNFGIVFKEFTKREAVYGFGDLQVKRIFDRLIEK